MLGYEVIRLLEIENLKWKIEYPAFNFQNLKTRNLTPKIVGR